MAPKKLGLVSFERGGFGGHVGTKENPI